jgi:hypothetical protein
MMVEVALVKLELMEGVQVLFLSFPNPYVERVKPNRHWSERCLKGQVEVRRLTGVVANPRMKTVAPELPTKARSNIWLPGWAPCCFAVNGLQCFLELTVPQMPHICMSGAQLAVVTTAWCHSEPQTHCRNAVELDSDNCGLLVQLSHWK